MNTDFRTFTPDRFYTILVISALFIGCVLVCGCTDTGTKNGTIPSSAPSETTVVKTPLENTVQNMTATNSSGSTVVQLQTTMGNIDIQLAPDMPITAGNFEKLARSGYYDGVIFHRVINGFMIQGGDPTGTGRGGPGYTIKDELTKNNSNARGTISMANAGPNTGGSQFFINLVNNNFLDPKHPAFGKVIAGMDVVDKIGKVKTDRTDRPVEEVRIIKAVILSPS